MLAVALRSRQLLSLADENVTGVAAVTPEAVAITVALAVLFVIIVLLCTCEDKSNDAKDAEPQAITQKSIDANKQPSLQVDSHSVAVEAERGITVIPDSIDDSLLAANGGVNSKNGSNSSGHNRQASSGSGQMRPTSLRELPDLPGIHHKRNASGIAVLENVPAARNEGAGRSVDDEGRYDHLGAKVGSNKTRAITYDHISLESPQEPSSEVTPASELDTESDGHYAQLRERTYDVVVEPHSQAVGTKADFDPYSKVKDDGDEENDPYAKLKDADDYAHLKHDHHISSPRLSKAINHVLRIDEEDAYEKVIGDSIVGRSKDVDDYEVVTNRSSVTVVPIHAASDHGSASNHGGDSPGEVLDHLQFADEDSDHQSDYATVVKDRLGSASGREESALEEDEVQEIEPYFTTPPEPPRMYGANEVVQGAAALALSNSGDHFLQEVKERKYTKVTARESLASMTARHALNTYETVPDLPENTYATVEGGSGDGVVRYAVPSFPNHPNLRTNANQINEMYAEIGTSASGSYTPSAPDPPSLDSLHLMTKSTTSNEGDRDLVSRMTTSQSGAGIVFTEDGYALVTKSSNFSPSETALPQIPRTNTSSSLDHSDGDVSINGVILKADYQSVKDCITDSENDPNYESVDEALCRGGKMAALKKSVYPSSSSYVNVDSSTSPSLNKSGTSPQRRRHEYEELTSGSSSMSASASAHPPVTFASHLPSYPSASVSDQTIFHMSVNHPAVAAVNETRQRVLEGHMYEDITEVQKRKISIARKSSNVKSETRSSQDL